MSAPSTLVSSLVPQVNLPDLGRIVLPNGERVDLRFLDNTAEQAITGTTELVVTVALALILLTLGWLLSNKVASLTQRALVRAKFEETFAAFIGSMARYTLFFACVLGAFNLMGISLVSTMAVFGAVGLAIAFALRNTLSHVAAGIMLVVNRPFKVGDYITMDGDEGTVKRITLFNTEVNTLTNQRVFMPNSKIWENVLVNHTYNDVRMIEFLLPMAIGTSLEHVRHVLTPVLQAHAKTLKKPEPLIGFDKFDFNGAVVLIIRVWVKLKDYSEVRYSLLDTLTQALLTAKLTPVAPLLRNAADNPMKATRHA
ncbi:MAG: mechanosensitive ion channel family protein [Alphaproteobacteria bacterium]|nr:mechanosensitive ion channel family protein [Alphaproteobacteria bacterium]